MRHRTQFGAVAMIGVTSARPLAPVIETARLDHGHRNERCQDCDDAGDDQSHDHRVHPIQIWAFEVVEAVVHDTTRFPAIERSAELDAKRLLINFCAQSARVCAVPNVAPIHRDRTKSSKRSANAFYALTWDRSAPRLEAVLIPPKSPTIRSFSFSLEASVAA